MIFSLDAETDGLYGPSVAIAATVRRDGHEIDQFVGRVPDDQVHDIWTRENVIPVIADMPAEFNSSVELEEAFWEFWYRWRARGVITIAHCAYPVESGLFRRCVERHIKERIFAGPFPAIHDVDTLLLLLEESPESVDKYIERHGLVAPSDGRPHNPMYDAIAAAVVWTHCEARLLDYCT